MLKLSLLANYNDIFIAVSHCHFLNEDHECYRDGRFLVPIPPVTTPIILHPWHVQWQVRKSHCYVTFYTSWELLQRGERRQRTRHFKTSILFFISTLSRLISICFTWKMLTNYPGTKLLWTGLKKEKRKTNLPQGGHVFEKILFFSTLLFWRGRQGNVPKIINAKCTCRAIVSVTKPIALWRPHCRLRC